MLLDFFMERYEDAYYREMQAFVDALIHGKKTPVGVHDGLMATAIGLAGQQSMREKRPVRIQEVLDYR